MIIKSYSIPSPRCIRSFVRPMTDAEIRLMNEQLAARRAAFVEQVRSYDPDAVDIDTPAITEADDERNSRPFHTSNGGKP